MDIKDMICIFILLVVTILDITDICNLVKKRDNDADRDKNKSKYILSFVLYGSVLFVSIYFAFGVILDNILR